jgi:hypothetical protein
MVICGYVYYKNMFKKPGFLRTFNTKKDYINRNFMSKPEKENIKNSKFSVEYIASSAWITVPFFGILGVILSYVFKLTMNKDVWFWFFSSIAQTFAALVALVAIFLISRLDLYNATIKKNKDIMRTVFCEFDEDAIKYVDDEMLMLAVNKSISLIEPRLETDTTALNSKSPKFKAISLIYAKKENDRLEQKMEQTKKQMRILLNHTFIIIMLSLFLIPFGAVITTDNLLLDLWNNFNLKWAVIFGIVGLCITSLHKVESMLKEILFKGN